MSLKKRVLIVVGCVALTIIVLGIVIALAAALFTVKVNPKSEGESVTIIGGADGPTSVFLAGKLGDDTMAEYTSINMGQAKTIFEEKGDYIILDVRRSNEFADGHIPGAINIANETIGEEMPAELPDKDQVIYVYCRSGRRSKEASAKLAALGYTNIVEFGGITDWAGPIEK